MDLHSDNRTTEQRLDSIRERMRAWERNDVAEGNVWPDPEPLPMTQLEQDLLRSLGVDPIDCARRWA